MKTIFLFAVVFSLHSHAQEKSGFYIQLGEAATKKSLLAFPSLLFTGDSKLSPKFQSVGAELYNVIQNDLQVSSYFEMAKASSYLENPASTGIKPFPTDPKGFHFDKWAPLGVDFLIRAAFTLNADKVELESYLYEIKSRKLVFGKKYSGTTRVIRRIGHSFANDVLKNLTGVDGMFLSQITFASDRTRPKEQWREIYSMDWDGENLQKITDLKTITKSPTWSPDGTKIAYTALVKRRGNSERNHDLFMVDLTNGKNVLISGRPGINSGAAFDPKGENIFLTISNGSEPDINKINLNSGTTTRLTHGPNHAMNVEPAVSPDGKQVAFSSDRNGTLHIFKMNIDGSKVEQLSKSGVSKLNSSPSWSADGTKIAFASYAVDHFDVFVMNSDGSGTPVRITTANKKNGRPANHEDPSFSPDGRFVVYTSDRNGKNQIFFSTVDGREEHQVTPDLNNYYRPHWSK